MDFDYTAKTKKDFNSAVDSVQEETTKSGMRVLHVHDIQKLLAEKGFDREPLKIIELCSAKYANDFLNININVGLCMPCRINVYEKSGQVFISGMRPIVLPQFFPENDFGNGPAEIDEKIRNIIDRAQ